MRFMTYIIYIIYIVTKLTSYYLVSKLTTNCNIPNGILQSNKLTTYSKLANYPNVVNLLGYTIELRSISYLVI